MPMDLLAVGDITIDNFIRLKDASVHCDIDKESCEICMRWGDKIPYDFTEEVLAVGNSANAAVAAARLGLKSSLRTYVGADTHGEQCVASLKKDGVDISLTEKVAGKRTNYHFVLWYESERTILIKHETFDYALPLGLSVAEGPKWFYLSSLGDGSLSYHHTWIELLEKWPETKLAFQPGTFQMNFGREALAAVYRRADIFFCNKEEAERILAVPKTDDVKNLLKQMRALGPKKVVITDDRKGAYAMNESDKAWLVPLYPDPRPPYERTGAGDAFASSVTSALALEKTFEEALLWGPVNAMSVVQAVGAQKGLLTRAELEEYLKSAPADYALKEL